MNITPGVYELATNEGSRRVRVNERDGHLRAWFIDDVGVICSGCVPFDITDEMQLTRSPEQEKVDLSQAIRDSRSDTIEQVTRLAEIAEKLSKNRTWKAVFELRSLGKAIQFLIEEL